eukprot:5637962-Prymnesium_polylepis.1
MEEPTKPLTKALDEAKVPGVVSVAIGGARYVLVCVLWLTRARRAAWVRSGGMRTLPRQSYRPLHLHLGYLRRTRRIPRRPHWAHGRRWRDGVAPAGRRRDLGQHLRVAPGGRRALEQHVRREARHHDGAQRGPALEHLPRGGLGVRRRHEHAALAILAVEQYVRLDLVHQAQRDAR